MFQHSNNLSISVSRSLFSQNGCDLDQLKMRVVMIEETFTFQGTRQLQGEIAGLGYCRSGEI